MVLVLPKEGSQAMRPLDQSIQSMPELSEDPKRVSFCTFGDHMLDSAWLEDPRLLDLIHFWPARVSWNRVAPSFEESQVLKGDPGLSVLLL